MPEAAGAPAIRSVETFSESVCRMKPTVRLICYEFNDSPRTKVMYKLYVLVGSARSLGIGLFIGQVLRS